MKKLNALLMVPVLWASVLSAQDVRVLSWGGSAELVGADAVSPRRAAGGEIPFSLETPLTPTSEYDGGIVYGGVKASGAGGLNAGIQILDNNIHNGGGNDVLQFGRLGSLARAGDRVTGFFYWKRSDFRTLNMSASGPLAVRKLSYRGRVNGRASSAEARFVVGFDGFYLISENVGLASVYSADDVSLRDMGKVRWYDYEPTVDLTKIGAEKREPDFSDAVGIGVYMTAANAGDGPLILALSSVAAEGNTAPLVFAYYPTYRQSSNLPVEKLPWAKITHVIHSFAKADESMKLSSADELLPSGDLTKAAHANGAKVLLALGGGANAKWFHAMAQDAGKRNAFVSEVAAWVKNFGYDGVVLDWEFPAQQDAQKVTNFIYALRKSLPEKSEIGMAVGVSAFTSAGIDGARRPSDDPSLTLDGMIDYLLVMSYDYHGAWNYAGFNTPLFEVPYSGDTHSFYSTYTLWSVTRRFSAAKIVMGLAFYGRTFSGYKSFGEKVSSSSAISYLEVLNRIKSKEWQLYRDRTEGMTDIGLFESHELPYMVKGDEMVSYDDVLSIPPKVRWFRGMGMRGYSIWEIGQDHYGGTNLLLDSARAVW